MIRVLWTTILGCLAIAVIGLELDRASRFDRELARMVPTSFRTFAFGPLIKAEMIAGNFENALALARQQLIARPMPAESVSDLAFAQLANGLTEEGVRTYEVAATRGWRDPDTQLMMASFAAENTEWDEAAKRLAGFLAANSRTPQRDAAALQLLTRPELIRALGRLLGRNPVWRERVLAWSASELSPAALAQMVTAGTSSGARFDCHRIADYARAAFEGGDANAGSIIWSACSKHSDLRANDLIFLEKNLSNAPQDPFAWEYPSKPNLTVEPNVGALRYELTTDLSRTAIASKRMTLSPGPHHLRITTTSATGTELAIDAQCTRPSGNSIAKRTGQGKWLLTVPASQCQVQRLTIIGSSGKADGIRLSVDRPS